jgi:hypothetical protein
MAWLGGMGRSNIGTLIVAISLSVGFFAEKPAMADERKILVASFENIQVIGDIKVQVQTGKAPSAKAKGDKRVLDALKLERVGMTLRVRLQGPLNNEKGVPMTQPLEVMLSTQAIKDMTVSGNGSLHIFEAKQQDAVRMLVAGNGSIRVKRLLTDRFSADIDGNGRIDIMDGKVRDGRVTLNGTGYFDATHVPMRTLRLEHIGNGESRVNVDEAANISNRGTGTINVGGSGSCFVKEAGSAAINCARIEKGTRK